MADEKEVKEVGKNCPACKKVMKRKKRYYRNGGYYCNKNCFNIAQAKKTQAAASTEEAK